MIRSQGKVQRAVSLEFVKEYRDVAESACVSRRVVQFYFVLPVAEGSKMRRDTKLAIGIGLVVVGFGAWYVNSPETKKTSDSDKAGVARQEDKSALPSADRPSGEKGVQDLSAKPTSHARREPVRGPDRSQSIQRPGRRSALKPADSRNLAGPIPGDRPGGLARSEADTTRLAKIPTTRPAGEVTSRPAATVLKKPDRKAPVQPPVQDKWHVIQAGDTYSALAKKYYGSVKYTSLLVKANPGTEPRRLMVGTKVRIPNLPASSVSGTSAVGSTASPSPLLMAEPIPSVPKDRAYTVKESEGWTALAERFLGDASRWPELYELNRERVPHNYNLRPAGTVIELPKEAVAKKN
ncbi:MAG: LysM peptidoglycan-binding domain-containing protein [Planctomycetota bacterium]|nr:MAG: LysM peptidoglycan-binding domain-containing protein [Planctomycetota bacterium]